MDTPKLAPRQPESSEASQIEVHRNVAQWVYLLLAAGFGTIVTFFIGIFIAYLRRSRVRELVRAASATGDEASAGLSMVISHFDWQIKTFYISAVWLGLGAIAFSKADSHFYPGLIVLSLIIWFAYRLFVGWLHLTDGKPPPS